MDAIKNGINSLPSFKGIISEAFREAFNRDQSILFLNGTSVRPDPSDKEWLKKNRFYSFKSLKAAGEQAAQQNRFWRLGWCLQQAEVMM